MNPYPLADNSEGWYPLIVKALRSYPMSYAEIIHRIELNAGATFPSDVDLHSELRSLVRRGLAQRELNRLRWSLPASQNEAEQLRRENERLKGELDTAVQAVAMAAVETSTLRSKLDAAGDKKESGPVKVVVIRETATAKKKKKVELAHFMMPKLLVRMGEKINTYLVGPAGSGKTMAAEQAAQALSLEFGLMSVGPQTTKSDIFGFISASGKYVPTEFRKRYEEGGVFLFDEIDAGNPGTLTQINASLAGSVAAFPDGMVRKHPEFRCIAAGNTFGTGPDRQYVGRQELDAASLDRFNFLEWPYDEGLELKIAEGIDEKLAQTWVPFVQQVRAAITRLSIRHVVSPRCSIEGTKLLLAEVDIEEVKTTQLWKSLKPDQVTRVLAEVQRTALASTSNLNNGTVTP